MSAAKKTVSARTTALVSNSRRRTARSHTIGAVGGPEWGTETEDLNATVLRWEAGAGPPEHVNAERDVVLVVLEGTVTLELDGETRRLRPGEVAVVEKGCRRRLTAGPDGVRYVTVHRRRGGLQIGTIPRSR